MKTKYKDCNGEYIGYGDILRNKSFEQREKSEYSPKDPFFMLVHQQGVDLMYVSGMDEFWSIRSCQTSDDAEDELKNYEIFINREVYEDIFYYHHQEKQLR